MHGMRPGFQRSVRYITRHSRWRCDYRTENRNEPYRQDWAPQRLAGTDSVARVTRSTLPPFPPGLCCEAWSPYPNEWELRPGSRAIAGLASFSAVRAHSRLPGLGKNKSPTVEEDSRLDGRRIGGYFAALLMQKTLESIASYRSLRWVSLYR